MCIEKEFLAEECGIDYDEVMSDSPLTKEDILAEYDYHCINCGWEGSKEDFESSNEHFGQNTECPDCGEIDSIYESDEEDNNGI